MSVICLFVLIVVQLTQSTFAVKFDVEDTICNLCQQRKSCKVTSPHRQKGTVLFMATFSNNTDINPRDKLVMDKVPINDGDLYHPGSGMFISDSDDVYLFNWNVLKRTGRYFSVHLVLDGKIMASSYSGISGHDQLSGSLALSLKKGDKVWLQGGHTKVSVHNLSYSFFSAVSL